jgi:hypothetical protein
MADFGENDASTQLVDAGNGGQELNRGAKGLDQSVDLRIDLVDCRVYGVDAAGEGQGPWSAFGRSAWRRR